MRLYKLSTVDVDGKVQVEWVEADTYIYRQTEAEFGYYVKVGLFKPDKYVRKLSVSGVVRVELVG